MQVNAPRVGFHFVATYVKSDVCTDVSEVQSVSVFRTHQFR